MSDPCLIRTEPLPDGRASAIFERVFPGERMISTHNAIKRRIRNMLILEFGMHFCNLLRQKYQIYFFTFQSGLHSGRLNPAGDNMDVRIAILHILNCLRQVMI